MPSKPKNPDDRFGKASLRCRRALMVGALVCVASARVLAAVSNDIKVDHFGYRSGDSKIAYCSANPGTVTVEVIDVATGAPAYSVPAASVSDQGSDPASPAVSGDHVWWIDFSALTTPGTYAVVVPALGEQSYAFTVNDALYQAPLSAALKSLYYARCGSPKTEANGGVWNDTACHLADLSSTAVCAVSGSYPGLDADYGTLNLAGGWHDAGDYEKKIGFGGSCGSSETGDNGDSLWYLLCAYELNTSLLSELSVNLPESGNGYPDVLNQAKWELDWYLKMQMPDAHVLEGIHVSNLGTLASPPSADTTARGYNPPSFESEAVFTACTAHAARTFAGLPGGLGSAYAADLSAAALATWNAWVSNSPATDPQAPSYYPYAAIRVWAASEIFRLAPSGPSAVAAKAMVDGYGNWSLSAASPAYSNYAIFNYLQTPGATAATQSAMRNALSNLANALFAPGAGQVDLYNAYMPSYQYSWGSNQAKADTGLFLVWLWYLSQLGQTGITGSYTPSACLAHAEDYLHYFHGDNPMNMVYMTNTDGMGAKHGVWQIFNSWFGNATAYGGGSGGAFIGKPSSVIDPLYPYVAADAGTSSYGPPPGYVPDGPTYQYFSGGGTDTPPDAAGPSEAPYAKAYRDYDNGSQPWVVNEAGIYDNSAYVMLASAFSGSAVVKPSPTPSPTASPTSPPTPVPLPTLLPESAGLYPNPVREGSTAWIYLYLDSVQDVTVKLYTPAFVLIQSLRFPGVAAAGQSLPVPLTDRHGVSLAKGLYFALVQASGRHWVQKIMVLN